jgi:hypothetical protein
LPELQFPGLSHRPVSLGWQYMLLAGLREMSGEIAAAAAALATAGLF